MKAADFGRGAFTMTHVPRIDVNAAGVRLNQPPDKGAEVGVTVLFRSFRLKVAFSFHFFLLNAVRGTQAEPVGAPRQEVPGPQPHKPSSKHPRTRTSYCATLADKQNTSFFQRNSVDEIPHDRLAVHDFSRNSEVLRGF